MISVLVLLAFLLPLSLTAIPTYVGYTTYTDPEGITDTNPTIFTAIQPQPSISTIIVRFNNMSIPLQGISMTEGVR